MCVTAKECLYPRVIQHGYESVTINRIFVEGVTDVPVVRICGFVYENETVR
jgi:hypothetical protein